MSKTFRFISIDRLYLALVDLLGKRVTSLRSFRYGAYAEPELIESRDSIAALPEAVRGMPQAAALAEADRDHDGHGSASIRVLQGHLLSPDSTPDLRDAAEKCLAFLGTLEDLQARYDVEAKRALEKRKKLPPIVPLLQLFPVAHNKTLADWVEAHVAAGEKIGALLSQRADAEDRALASALRNRGVKLLNTVRGELGKARKKNNPPIPESLDQDIFAFCDQLEAEAAAAAAAEKKAEGERKTADKTKKAEAEAKKADELAKQATEAARRANEAQKAAEEAQKLAEEARRAADKAREDAEAPPPAAPATPAVPPGTTSGGGK